MASHDLQLKTSRTEDIPRYSDEGVLKVVNSPHVVRGEDVGAIGVAFITAAIALGVSIGVTFPHPRESYALDLLEISRRPGREGVVKEICDEVFDQITLAARPYKGDWILIMGAMYYRKRYLDCSRT